MIFEASIISLCIIFAIINYYVGNALIGMPADIETKRQGWKLTQESFNQMLAIIAFMIITSLHEVIQERLDGLFTNSLSLMSSNVNTILLLSSGIAISIIGITISIIIFGSSVPFYGWVGGIAVGEALAYIASSFGFALGTILAINNLLMVYATFIQKSWFTLLGIGILLFCLPFRIGKNAGMLVIMLVTLSLIFIPLFPVIAEAIRKGVGEGARATIYNLLTSLSSPYVQLLPDDVKKFAPLFISIIAVGAGKVIENAQLGPFDIGRIFIAPLSILFLIGSIAPTLLFALLPFGYKDIFSRIIHGHLTGLKRIGETTIGVIGKYGVKHGFINHLKMHVIGDFIGTRVRGMKESLKRDIHEVKKIGDKLDKVVKPNLKNPLPHFILRGYKLGLGATYIRDIVRAIEQRISTARRKLEFMRVLSATSVAIDGIMKRRHSPFWRELKEKYLKDLPDATAIFFMAKGKVTSTRRALFRASDALHSLSKIKSKEEALAFLDLLNNEEPSSLKKRFFTDDFRSFLMSRSRRDLFMYELKRPFLTPLKIIKDRRVKEWLKEKSVDLFERAYKPSKVEEVTFKAIESFERRILKHASIGLNYLRRKIAEGIRRR